MSFRRHYFANSRKGCGIWDDSFCEQVQSYGQLPSSGIHALLWVKQIASGKLLTEGAQLVLCGDLEGGDGVGWSRREAQEGEKLCILTADSCWCTTETSTTL